MLSRSFACTLMSSLGERRGLVGALDGAGRSDVQRAAKRRAGMLN